MKNRIHANVIPVEELLVAYYINGLPTPIAMWEKRAHKNNQQEAFVEAILVENDMFYLKHNPNFQA